MEILIGLVILIFSAGRLCQKIYESKGWGVLFYLLIITGLGLYTAYSIGWL